MQVMLEWQRDWLTRNYDAVMDIVKNHYGAYGIGSSTHTDGHGAPATKFPEYAFPLPLQLTSKPEGRSLFRPSQSICTNRRETAVSAELILHNAEVATNGVPSLWKRSPYRRKDSCCRPR